MPVDKGFQGCIPAYPSKTRFSRAYSVFEIQQSARFRLFCFLTVNNQERRRLGRQAVKKPLVCGNGVLRAENGVLLGLGGWCWDGQGVAACAVCDALRGWKWGGRLNKVGFCRLQKSRFAWRLVFFLAAFLWAVS